MSTGTIFSIWLGGVAAPGCRPSEGGACAQHVIDLVVARDHALLTLLGESSAPSDWGDSSRLRMRSMWPSISLNR
jgi:hypothetical protein